MNIIVEEQKIEPQIIADDDDDPPALQADQDNIVVEVVPDDMNFDELTLKKRLSLDLLGLITMPLCCLCL